MQEEIVTKKLNFYQLGQRGEDLARQYLEKQGLTLQKHNFRFRQGEIDLIGWDKNTLVFIEVKYRRSKAFGNPLEAIHPKKQRQIIRASEYFLLKYPHQGMIRFDALGILEINGEIEYFYIQDAFGQ